MTYDKKSRIAWDAPFSRAREPRAFAFVPRPLEGIAACKKCGKPEPKPRTPNQEQCNPCSDLGRWGSPENRHWVKKPFAIVKDGVKRFVTGYVKEPWAIHKVTDKVWMITYMPTGALFGTPSSLAKAKAMCAELEEKP